MGRAMGTGLISRKGKRATGVETASGQSWIDQELGAGPFSEVRLDQRLRTLLEQLSSGVGESIPLVCQDSRQHQSGLSIFVQ